MQDAEKAALQAAQVSAEQQASIAVTEAPVVPSAGVGQSEIDMDVDQIIESAVAEGSSKRKAEEEGQPETSKKARFGK